MGSGRGLPVELRARLAIKGKLLYGKFCGTGGRGICADSFALYHLWRGEPEVALDLLAFLEAEIQTLRIEDPNGRLALTEDLASRLERHLEHEREDPLDPSRWTSILKAKKQNPGLLAESVETKKGVS
jgi:hypothetical protein